MRNGALRYCPICDGYEVTDKRVGVIGTEATIASRAYEDSFAAAQNAVIRRFGLGLPFWESWELTISW